MEYNKKISFLCGEILFYIHLPIVAVWVVLFFIPSHLWPARAAVHFYYIMSLVATQILGGIFYWPILKKFDLRCPITILMQLVRGYPLRDPKTYNHSFVVELFERLQIKPKKKTISLLIIVSIIAVSYLFLVRH